MPLLFVFICGWLFALPALPSQSATRPLSTAEAKAHVGERVEVCGVVVSVVEPRPGQRTPTYLNFDKPYPQTEFTAIIWKWQRPVFLNLHLGVSRKVCVTGQVREYRGRAQITLTKAAQLRVSD